MTVETDIDRLFGALAKRDLAAAAAALAPDAVVWHNFDGIANDRADTLASFADLIKAFPEIAFHDVRRQATPTGYVQQHVMAVKTADGRAKAWPICAVVRLENGLVARVDEYLDRANSFAPDEGPLATPGFQPLA